MTEHLEMQWVFFDAMDQTASRAMACGVAWIVVLHGREARCG